MGRKKDANQAVANNNSYFILDKKIIPLVDAHMHIQSNDIAPIPIMYGVAYFNGVKLAAFNTRVLQEHINYHELSFLNMDKFPSKDNISPGILTDESILGNIFTGVAGNSRRSATDATATLVKDYGKIARYTSFNMANIYMGHKTENSTLYSSRRIIKNSDILDDPENYLEDESSRKKSAKILEKLINKRNDTLDTFQTIILNYYNSFEGRVSGIFEFSIVLGMELMYAHYWGAYGIPIYIFYNDQMYYVSINVEYNIDILSKEIKSENTFTCYNAYDMPKKILYENFKVFEEDEITKNISVSKLYPVKYSYKHKGNTNFFNDEIEELMGKSGEKYKHFLVPVRKEEVVQYEDFEQHLEYTRMAAIKHPFKLLPFYHFDPRRFYSPEINKNLHEFFIREKNNKNHLIKVKTKAIKEAINEQKPFVNTMNISELKQELLLGEELQSGIFWGVKMYAALGCPPYIYMPKESNKIFKYLNTGEINKERNYNNLKDFYLYCARNKIPITCHCSPQGMTIADPCVYLKEYLKQQERSKYYKEKKICFPIGRRQFLAGIGLIDDFSSPESWKKVLKDVPDLKLCLAHYGGSGFLDGKYKDDSDTSPYCWHHKISALIKDNKQVYTDISNYAVGEPPDLLDEITRSEYNYYLKDYKDILIKLYEGNRAGTFTYIKSRNLNNEEKMQKMFLRLEMIRQNKQHYRYKKITGIANKLAKDIGENKRLRYRIMFGTDWPMSEINVKGTAYYSSCIFIILQLLTEELNEGWDAWHQFTVINPLRFLGLLEDFVNPEEEGKKNDNYELKFEFDKIDKYNTKLKEYTNSLKDSKYLSIYEDKYLLNIEEDIKSFNDDKNENENSIYIKLKIKYGDDKYKIPVAHSIYMKNKNGKLIILEGKSKEDNQKGYIE